MSDHEIESGTADPRPSTPPVVVVDTASSRRAIPYWTTDQEISPNVFQKRSSNIESMERKWHDKTLKDCASGMSTEARKTQVNLQSKKRSRTLVALPMTPVVTNPPQMPEVVKPVVIEQPKPQLASEHDLDEEKPEILEIKQDGDSISSEITELQTPETLKKSSEWDQGEREQVPADDDNLKVDQEETNIENEIDNQDQLKDDNELEELEEIPLQNDIEDDNSCEEIEIDEKADLALKEEAEKDAVESNIENKFFKLNADQGDTVQTTSRQARRNNNIWDADVYLNKVHLQDLCGHSSMLGLEQRTSIGPCYRAGLSYAEPLGISICTPKKLKRINIENNLDDDGKPLNTGICIMSKGYKDGKPKCLRAKSNLEIRGSNNNISQVKMKSDMQFKVDHENKYDFGLRGKLNSLCLRIKHSLRI